MTISVGHGKGKASQLQTSPSSHVFCFTGYKLRKTDPESSNYLRYRRGNVFPDCDCFCPPFWKRDAADNLSRTRNVHDFWQCSSSLRTGNKRFQMRAARAARLFFSIRPITLVICRCSPCLIKRSFYYYKKQREKLLSSFILLVNFMHSSVVYHLCF